MRLRLRMCTDPEFVQAARAMLQGFPCTTTLDYYVTTQIEFNETPSQRFEAADGSGLINQILVDMDAPTKRDDCALQLAAADNELAKLFAKSSLPRTLEKRLIFTLSLCAARPN